MSELFQSKALLAKLLAKENLIIEERNVDTAHFDLEQRILCIPVLKSNLLPCEYDLFIGHEVGHALFTPTDNWMDAIKRKKVPKSVVNVVEDARIERKIKSRYPGLRNSFSRAYNKLVSEDFFGTNGRDLTKLNFIDRANLHFKAGAAFGIVFKNDAEKKFIKEIDSTDTFEDVVELSERIVKYLREEVKDFETEKPKPQPIKVKVQIDSIETLDDVDQLMEELSEMFEESITTTSDSDEDEKTDEESKNDAPVDGKGKETEEKEEGDGAGASEMEKVSDLPAEEQEEKIDELIESSTDNSYQENTSKFIDRTSMSPTNVKLPEPNLSEIVVPYKNIVHSLRNHPILSDEANRTRLLKNYHDYSKSVSKMVSYLVKEFELRKNADLQKRAKTSKTGEIDVNRLHSYRFSEDIFKRLTSMPEGKSHGLVMYIDWSGSMANMIQNTIRQLISLVLFCKKVNIPFEVYAVAEKFDGFSHKNQFSKNEKELLMGRLALVNLFSSKMSAADFTFMAATFSSPNIKNYVKYIMPMSSTPLNEAIIASMKMVPKFKEDNNLQIVNTVFLSDGASNGNTNYYDKRSHNGMYQYTGDVAIHDQVSRYTEKVKLHKVFSHEAKSIAVTKALIRHLKHRTKSHVLGFFVTETRDFNSTIPFFPSHSDWYNAKEVFAADKIVIVENTGYDEFYIIKNEYQEIEDFSEVAATNSSVRSVLSAFKKHTKTRLHSRTMLNSFIKMIA